MIDPEKVTNYNQTDKELEEFILFWVCAAGKNGRTAARSLYRLLTDLGIWFSKKFTPFGLIRMANDFLDLAEWMRVSGIGCFNQKAKTFYALATSGLDLKTCPASDLESIFGIGPKTARCFILHSRRDAQHAGLDTHMLKHLRALGYDVPKSTPTGKKYLTLEKNVLYLAKEAGMSPADYDLMIWNKYSK
jgi:hypothetical protein